MTTVDDTTTATYAAIFSHEQSGRLVDIQFLIAYIVPASSFPRKNDFTTGISTRLPT